MKPPGLRYVFVSLKLWTLKTSSEASNASDDSGALDHNAEHANAGARLDDLVARVGPRQIHRRKAECQLIVVACGRLRCRCLSAVHINPRRRKEPSTVEAFSASPSPL